ncbi:MAG: Asp-tRNA(Asn)/Glu-tRNA(Gln) amidotransferase subunit GatA [Promethearchaeota archaeon]
MSATELLLKLETQEVTAAEVVEDCLRRIDEVEAHVNAFTTVDAEGAREAARKVDSDRNDGRPVGRLAGVPIAVKDCISVRGSQTSCGSRMLEGYLPLYDATVVDRLIRREGAVLIGRTNMDEFAMGSSTESSYYGITYNPWDRSRVPGGSSGGSGAALAACETVVALGSDTGGSIRCPASYCGVSGIKGTYGRVSRYGLVSYANSLEQIGPMARSVADCALMLELMAGDDPLDTTTADVPVAAYTSALTDDLDGVTIGLPSEFFGEGVGSSVKSLVKDAVKVMEKCGAQSVEVSLPHIEYAIPTYYLIAMSEASSNLARFDGIRYGFTDLDNAGNWEDNFSATRSKGFGPEVRRRIILGTYALSAGFYDMFYLKALQVRTLIKRDFQAALEKCDVLVGPTMPAPAFKIGTKNENPLEMYMEDILTVPVNLAGVPSLAVPCGFDGEGLPVGMQVMGDFFDEATVLKVGHAYQTKTDFHERIPELGV